MSRERLLVRTMVELADGADGRVVVAERLALLAQRCTELLDVAGAGVLLVSEQGGPAVVASSSEAVRTIQLFESESSEGPGPECCRSGRPVVNATVEAPGRRWPRFEALAYEAGYRSDTAVPLRHGGHTKGAVELFQADSRGLDGDDVSTAAALAEVATIAILRDQAVRNAEELAQQLDRALRSRVAIEQAKGMLAERAGLGMGEAFSALRAHARRHNTRLADVADDFIHGRLAAADLGLGGPAQFAPK